MNDMLKAKLFGIGAAVIGFSVGSKYVKDRIESRRKAKAAADKWILENITIFPINCNGYSLEGIWRDGYVPKKLIAEEKEDEGG